MILAARITISIAALLLATGTAHAEDALVVSRGVEWKCPDGIIIRFDSIGGRYEEGASTTLTIMGLSRLGPNNLHIVDSKESKRDLRERLKGRSPFLLNGKYCTIQD